MNKDDGKRADSLDDAMEGIGINAKDNCHEFDVTTFTEKPKKSRNSQPSADEIEHSASLSYYLYSIFLLSCRSMSNIRDWYGSFFSLSLKDKAKLHRNISQQYLNNGSTEKAMGHLKVWARIDRNDPEPIFQIGVALATHGEIQRAVNAFDKVLKMRPGHTGALYRMSALLLKLKRYKEAISGLQPITEEKPLDPRAHHLLGLAYDGDGQLEKGIESMRKAVELDPGEIKYHQYLGFMSVRKEDHATAAEHFTKVMELERSLEEDSE